MTAQTTLSDSIRLAISHRNITELYRLKDICDHLHQGFPTYESFNESDLPTDSLYEELVSSINNIASSMNVITSSGLQSHATITRDGKQVNNKEFLRTAALTELWMGSIPKPEIIQSIPFAVILPKFDGCSCGVKFEHISNWSAIKATTRGTDAAFHKQTSNVLIKFNTISQPILDALNSNNDFQFNLPENAADVIPHNKLFQNRDDRPYPFKYASSINIRGEIVIKDKSLVDGVPAAFIAGKLNGDMKVWEDALLHITFEPFEIMKIVFKLPIPNPLEADTKFETVEYIPTQLETIRFFEKFGLCRYSKLFADLSNSEIITLNKFSERLSLLSEHLTNSLENSDKNKSDKIPANTDSLGIITQYFQHCQESIPSPIDGVVYCPITWTYPQTKYNSTPTNYNKFAWKPHSESTTILREIKYSIARDGKLGLILSYDPILINGKKYKNAKTAFTHIINDLPGIGIGSTIVIELRDDISPYIKEVIPENNNENIIPYELPRKCPFCESDLKQSRGKTITCTCQNMNCKEMLIQKYCNFLTIIKIKGIAEGKLRKLKTLDIFEIHNSLMKDDGIITSLREMNLFTFLGSIGFGNKRQIESFCTKHKMSTMTMLLDAGEIVDVVKNMYKHDTFVSSIMEFIQATLFDNDSEEED